MRGGALKRRKHSRSRTGCLTCRRRRIKCDEKRPICGCCEKGPRECVYPPSPEEMEDAVETATGLIEFCNSTDSDKSSTELVKFSSPLRKRSLSTAHDEPFDPIQIDPDCAIESFMPSLYPIEPLLPEPFPTAYFQILQSQKVPLSILESKFSIPKSVSPHGFRSQLVQFLLKYHRDNITEAHYLRWYDYPKLCTVLIFAIAETSYALQHAMIAFSAFILSIKRNPRAREVAFRYYSVALRQLRSLLDKSNMDMSDCFAAVATALQLSLFDRFFGDIKKCFQHLQGAARIMQQVTNPVQLCSTVIGRSLLEWFMQFEDYCCMMGGYELLLPRCWRDEDVRIRHKLAIVEYPRLADNARKARILDDVWAEFWAIVTLLVEVVYELRKFEGKILLAAAIELHAKLTQFEDEMEQLLNLPHVLEVLELAALPSPLRSTHADCCPDPPLTPYTFQFPPSGVFQIVIFATKGHIQYAVRPQILNACGQDAKHPKTDPSYSIEICRTYAGIEDVLGDNPDACLPLFAPLLLAISTCPKELRPWLGHKLAHFEQLGLATFENPVLKSLSKLWELEDIRPAIKGVSELLSSQDDSGNVVET